MVQFTLTFLGQFQVKADSIQVTEFHSNKARALLAYLALEPQGHARTTLATLLWPEIDDKYALTNLRTTLYRLRQTLDDAAQGAGDRLLTVTRQAVQFNSAHTLVDALQFQTLLSQESTASPPTLDHLTEAVALYQGELLMGFSVDDAPSFEEWLLLRRELLHQQAVLACHMLVTAHENAGRYEQAYPVSDRMLTLDPYREETYRQRMRLLARMRQPYQSLQQLEQLRRVLREEMGIDPSAETLLLAEQIVAGKFEKLALNSVEGMTGAQAHPEHSQSDNKMASVYSTLQSSPHPVIPSSGHLVTNTLDMRDVPDPGFFFGREEERQQIAHWVLQDRCRVVAILGIGGMGKTSLTAQCVREMAVNQGRKQFDVVLWRSLVNAPPLIELLPPLLQTLSAQQLAEIPESLDEQLHLLLVYLRTQRVLLVLDNMESILEPAQAGAYRPGYEPYGQIIQQVATLDHQSHLLLTSRERPRGYQRLARDGHPVQVLQLVGLDTQAGHQLLRRRGLRGDGAEEALLIARYSGNPLALKLVADTVEEIFGGNVAEFLAEETVVFDDIRTILDQHFARLTALEQQLLFWLAIEREPTSLATLRSNLLHQPQQQLLLEALRNLQRRSLIERQSDGFALQNVVTEYLTDRLVAAAITELTSGVLEMLHRHPLIMAQAKEYVRESQVRLIMQPVAEQVVDQLGVDGLAVRLQKLLDRLRGQGPRLPSYAGGNLLNLLIYLQSSAGRGGQLSLTPANYDFSRLSLWQAHLRGALLPAINLAESDLTHATFTQALGLVTAVAISRDGQRLAAGGSSNDINIWQLSDFQPLMTLQGHSRNVSTIAFSPDGYLLACATMHGMVCMWELQSGHMLWSVKVSQTALYSVAFSLDGRFLAVSGHGSFIYFWDSHRGTDHCRLYTMPEGGTFVVAFHPDRPLLAGANTNNCIPLWNIAHLIARYTHTDGDNHGADTDVVDADITVVRPPTSDEHLEITAFAFSPDGLLFASGDSNGLIELWDAQTLDHMRTLRGHQTELKEIEFSPDSRTLVSAGLDQTLRLWDVQRGVCDALFAGDGTLWSATFTPDGQRLVSCGEQGMIRIWDVTPNRQIEMVKILQSQLQVMPAADFSPSGQLLAIGDSLGMIRLWDLTQAVPICVHALQAQDWVESLAFHPSGDYFASAGGIKDHTIQLWNISSKQCATLLTGHKQQVLVLAFSPDGTLLASAGHGGVVYLWDLSDPNNGKLRNVLHGHVKMVCDLTFNRSGTQLASCSPDSRIVFWDTATGNQLYSLTPYGSQEIVQFSPSADTLACYAGGNLIRLVDTATHPDETEVMALAGHGSKLNSISFSPNGNLLVSGSLDRSVRLWDLTTGKERYCFADHQASVTMVRFNPDGRHFLSSGLDGTARLWDAETGTCIHVFHAVGPYEGMNINGVTGISEAQRSALKALGAVETPPLPV